MFHFKNRWGDGTATRGSCDIAVGDCVRSRYRAGWQGVVRELCPETGLARVEMTRDRHGNPPRKPREFAYHCHWFAVLERPVTP